MQTWEQDFYDACEQLGFAQVWVTDAQPFDFWREAAIRAGNPDGLTHDPAELMPEAKRIAILIWPYAPSAQADWPEVHISSYYVASNTSNAQAAKAADWLIERGYAAIARPKLPAKAAAQRAGVGDYGKNGLLYTERWGSRVALQMILTDAPLALSQAGQERPLDGCGSCTVCHDACPTGALSGDAQVDQSRCLRQWMFSGEVVPEAYRPLMKNRLIGCEDCQSVCPRNAKNRLASDRTFGLNLPEMLEFNSVTQQRFAELVGKNYARKQRVWAQAALIAGNSGDAGIIPALRDLANSEYATVREHARSAIAQLCKE